MGRGLAYGKKIGDLLLAENIEKVYELSGDGQSRVTDLLSGIPDEVLEIAFEHQRRGADVSKIVTMANSIDEEMENLKIMDIAKSILL